MSFQIATDNVNVLQSQLNHLRVEKKLLTKQNRKLGSSQKAEGDEDGQTTPTEELISLRDDVISKMTEVRTIGIGTARALQERSILRTMFYIKRFLRMPALIGLKLNRYEHAFVNSKRSVIA